MKSGNRYFISLLSAACAVSVAPVLAFGQDATVSGRVTNASGGAEEPTQRPSAPTDSGRAAPAAFAGPGGCVLRPDGSCGEALVTVREVNDPPACLSAGETETPDEARAAINAPRSNIRNTGMTGEVTEAPVGPPGAPVVTSRSNKRAGMAAEETEAPVGPPGAPISTTRSNIRRPGVAISASTVEAADAPAAAPFALDIGTTESLVLNAGGGNDTISTTRSIIRRPGVAISASNNERCEVGAERQEAPNGG